MLRGVLVGLAILVVVWLIFAWFILQPRVAHSFRQTNLGGFGVRLAKRQTCRDVGSQVASATGKPQG